MKKFLILLVWLLGLAVIAWLCLRWQQAALPATATAESTMAGTATPSTAAATMATTATPAASDALSTAAAAAGTGTGAGAAAASPPAAAALPASAGASDAAGPGTAQGSPDAAAARAKIEQLLESKVVEFSSSRAVLTADGQATVAEIAKILKDYPNLKVEVQGHTDSTGPDDVNHAISHARADAVKSVLVSRGVEAARVTTAGFGSTQPVADNSTAQGRARNRRIAFQVEENK